MPRLIVRHQHSRFQLRRPTPVTTALGIAVLIAAAFLLLFAFATAANDPRGLPCPAFFGIGLLLVGTRLVTAGALLLETLSGSTYVASLDRKLNPGELKAIRVGCRGTEVEVTLELQDSTTSATQGFLTAKDPEGLAKQLQGELGVPALVDR